MFRLSFIRTAACAAGFAAALLTAQNAAFALDLDDIEEALPRLSSHLQLPADTRRLAEDLPDLRVPRLAPQDLGGSMPGAGRTAGLRARSPIVLPVDIDD